MANKSDILYEKNKYNRLKNRVDDLNNELSKMIQSSDYSLDGKTDNAIKSKLNEGKRNLNNLKSTIYTLEGQLSKLADNLDREQKRLEEEAKSKEA